MFYRYHSHLGSQYVDGVRGAIVIYGGFTHHRHVNVDYPIHRLLDPNDPHKSLYGEFLR